MAEVKFSEKALRDMDSIAAYIARDPEFHASKQIERFLAGANGLKIFPLKGHLVPEVDHPTVRELKVGNYRLIYRLIENDVVEILTVHHGARRFPYTRIPPGTTRSKRTK